MVSRFPVDCGTWGRTDSRPIFGASGLSRRREQVLSDREQEANCESPRGWLEIKKLINIFDLMDRCCWQSLARENYRCIEPPSSRGALCIFHDPNNHMFPADVAARLTERIAAGDCDFRGARFPRGLVWPSGPKELRSADFSEATFETPVEFGLCTFIGPTYFSGATFRCAANFANVRFQKVVNFTEARFDDAAVFRKAWFDDNVYFDSVCFKGVDFNETVTIGLFRCNFARFAGPAVFTSSIFRSSASFSSCFFSRVASFSAAQFAEPAANNREPVLFVRAEFCEAPVFDSCRFWQAVCFRSVVFHAGAAFRATVLSNDGKAYSLDLADARLDGETLFSGLEMSGVADFDRMEVGGNLRFQGPFYVPHDYNQGRSRVQVAPRIKFESVVLRSGARVRFDTIDLSRTTFLGSNARAIEFHNVTWPRRALGLEVPLKVAGKFAARNAMLRFLSHQTTWDEWEYRDRDDARRVFRDLKARLEDQRDYADAGDLYYSEMESRRRGASWYQKTLLWLYWMFCGYGEKPLRAAGMFLCIWIMLAAGLTRTQFTFDSSASWRDAVCTKTGCRPSFSETTGQSIRDLTLQQRNGYMQPFSPWSHRLGLLGNALGPIQLGLFFLAMRRRFRR